MIILITIIHVIVCFFLIIVVLLQSGQSGDITAAFGGMGSQTAFGPRGAATILSQGNHLVHDYLYGDLGYAFGVRIAPCECFEIGAAGDSGADAAGGAGTTGEEIERP